MLSSSPLLLLLLPLLPPSLGCHTSSFTECQLLPFVPGHNLAGEGFDVVKMQTSGASVVDVKSFMVGGAQGNCTVCFNHLLNQVQQVFSQTQVKETLTLTTQYCVSVYCTCCDVTQVGLSIAGLGGFAVGGSHSVSSQFAESHSRKDKWTSESDSPCSFVFSFRLHSRPPLSKEFKVSLKNLPSTYHHKNTSAFQHFISIYGTHFIRRVHLGGRVHSMTAIRTCEAAMSKLSVRTVSNCLSVEASATIKGVTAKASSEFCHKKSKSLKTGVLGGDGNVGDILFNPNGAAGYKKWLHSLSRVPGVVSYQISPLHLLVSNNPILKSSLRDAISDYIRKSAKALHCSPSCKIGNQNQNCACQCKGHHMVDSNCCPAEPGVARLNVTVVQAQGLWGDYFSKTDGYVKVFYGGQSATTPVIWNDDFPRWNYLVRFQTVNLRHRVPVIFEVWDRDNVWDDDLLGKVSVIPTMGRNVHKTFKLKHGSLFVKLSAVCAPSLQGSLCENYVASPDYQVLLCDGATWLAC
uniref:Perforin 1.3 n=1 Tax=Lates calcarifer TaxID=8187 RepID=A0A4W6F787_LATCA